MPSNLPLLGGICRTSSLRDRIGWFVSDQRDLEITDLLAKGFLDGDWRSAAREAASILEGHSGRRGAHAPFDGLPIDAPDPRVAQVIRERLFESLEFAAITGCTHLVVHSPFLYFGRAASVHRGTDLDSHIARVRTNLEPVVAAAQAQRCRLVIENIFDLRPEPLDALVRAFDSEWVRRSLDTGHAHLMATRGAPPPDVWVDVAGPLLAHLHLADNDGESDRHWCCGAGGIAWDAVFLAISRLPAAPRLILEMSAERQAASTAWLSAHGLAR